MEHNKDCQGKNDGENKRSYTILKSHLADIFSYQSYRWVYTQQYGVESFDGFLIHNQILETLQFSGVAGIGNFLKIKHVFVGRIVAFIRNEGIILIKINVENYTENVHRRDIRI